MNTVINRQIKKAVISVYITESIYVANKYQASSLIFLYSNINNFSHLSTFY